MKKTAKQQAAMKQSDWAGARSRLLKETKRLARLNQYLEEPARAHTELISEIRANALAIGELISRAASCGLLP